MNLGILETVLFVITFFLTFYVLFRSQKTEQTLNGITWLFLSLLMELCAGAFFAGIINIIRVPINLWSMSCINFCIGGIVYLCLCHKKKMQKYYWDRFDIAYLLSLFICMVAFFLYFRGTNIELKFYNSDAGVHMKNIMGIVRDEHLSTMYFSGLWTAMVIECFLPFIKEIHAYKIFIVVDYVFLFLEIEIFMICIREYIKSKKEKVAAVVLSVFYALGYPALCYLFSFFYWGIGVLLVASLLLYAKYYQENKIQRSQLVWAMMLTCNAITMCYMLLGPLSFVMLFLYLTYLYITEHHKLDWQWVVLCLKVYLVPTIMAIYYCYIVFLAKANLSVGEVLNTPGGTYSERHLNFWWMLPLGMYMFIRCIKTKKIDMLMTCAFCNLLVIAVFILLRRQELVSQYYFSKLYYPMWLFCFMISFQAICSIMEKHSKLVAGYGIIVLLVIVGYFGKYESQMLVKDTDIEAQLHNNSKLGLYGYNCGLYRMLYVQYPEEYLEACDYVIEQLQKERDVPMLAGIENNSHCYWYEAITGQECSEYYGWTQDFVDIQHKLDAKDVNYFVIYKNTYLYLSHRDYFESFNKVYDNELAMVCSTGK